jgi:hypothetical protein
VTKVKRSPSKRAWVIIPQAVFVIVGLGALAAVMGDAIRITTCALLFGAALAGSVVFSHWMMRSYKCPDCGANLAAPSGWWYRLPGQPILLRCARCDTDWDFGLRGHED